jgi:hypothetical protein
MLTLGASFLFAWQVIALALLMTTWRSSGVEQKSKYVFNENNVAGLYGVSAVGIALSIPPGGFYFLLFLFHTYLQIRGITTYEYLIERSNKTRAQRAAKIETQLQKEQRVKGKAAKDTVDMKANSNDVHVV